MMNHLPTTIFENHSTFYMEVCIDSFNKRIRVDDYRGNIKKILVRAEELVKQHQVEKLIIKARMEDTISLFEFGLQPEAIVDHYFRGSNAYFYTKYYIADRKKNDHWMTEDAIIHSIYQLDHVQQNLTPPKDYEIKKADENQAAKLSALYRQVFQIYPTPLNDPEYIKKTMQGGTIYYVFLHQGDIVSAASAEINDFYKNAELTDCATLPEHRKYGLMKILLNELEGELIKKGIFCSYSIARSLSFGMNAALYQLGYSYRGRLVNNVYIYDKLEDMNMWVKNLAGC